MFKHSGLVPILLLLACAALPARAHAAGPCAHPHASEVTVDSAAGLSSALAAAKPGRLIRLRPGVYSGRFRATAQGTATQRIVLCGPRDAILDGGSYSSGYTLHLDGARYWTVSGFSVRRGKEGVMLDRAYNNLLTGLLVRDVGQSGIHLRHDSSGNSVAYSEIRDTGKYVAGYGEGVYIGSAVSNWEDVMGSSTTPDRSDRNRVRYNSFGPGIAAEAIDIKEGTTGGRIVGNVFDGSGMTGANYADSWIDVKGNGYTIADNTGVGTLRDGYQTHVAVSGWGNDNVFANNLSRLFAPGYAISVDSKSRGTVVRCSNSVLEAGLGLSNVRCQP